MSGPSATGVSPFSHVDVEFDDGSSAELLLKIKSNNVLKNGINLVSGKDFRLMKELVLHKKVLGYDKSYLREDVLYREIDSSLKNAMIDYYGFYDDRRSGTKNLLFKYYAWNEQGLDAKALRAVLDRILPFHMFYMGRDEDAGKLQLNKYNSRDYFKARPCLHMMFDLREEENNRTYGSYRIRALHEFIDRIHEEEARYDAFKTFTHNDFSSRNFFVRGEEVLFYDFELACYQSRRGLVGGSTFRRTPISRAPLDKNPMPGHLSELQPVNAVYTKGQSFRASFGKKPRFQIQLDKRPLSPGTSREAGEFHASTQDEA